MRQQNRHGSIAFAPFVNEMYADAIHHRPEMVEEIQALFLLPPVESIPPISAQLLEIMRIGSRIPSGIRNAIGPARAGQTLLKVIQHGLLHVDLIALHRHGSSSISFLDSGRSVAGCSTNAGFLKCTCRNKIGWAVTLLRKTAQPLVLQLCLSGLATGAHREVDDLAPQIFRSPLLLGLEVCWDIEFNQFRHDVLLAGDPTPLRDVHAEPM